MMRNTTTSQDFSSESLTKDDDFSVSLELMWLLNQEPKSFEEWYIRISSKLWTELRMWSVWYEDRTLKDLLKKFMMDRSYYFDMKNTWLSKPKNLVDYKERYLQEVGVPRNLEYTVIQNNTIINIGYFIKIFNKYLVDILNQDNFLSLDQRYIDYIDFVSRMYERKIAENYLREHPIRIINQYPQNLRGANNMNLIARKIYKLQDLNYDDKFKEKLLSYLLSLPEVSELIWTQNSGRFGMEWTDWIGFVVDFETGPQPFDKPKTCLEEICSLLENAKDNDWVIDSKDLYARIQQLKNLFLAGYINPHVNIDSESINEEKHVHNMAFYGKFEEKADSISWHVLNVLEQLSYDYNQIKDSWLLLDYVKSYIELVENQAASKQMMWQYDTKLLQCLKHKENSFFPTKGMDYLLA